MFSLLNENEHWSAIEDYEGLYAISNMGRVYSHITNRILKGIPNKKGYLKVNLRKDGIRKTIAIHVLVGNAFIGKREGELPTFDHIDINNQNNCADNIRLATRSEQSINRTIFKNNKTGYKNISIRVNRYIIQIRRNKKIVFDKSYPKKDYTLEQVVEERNRFLEDYV